MSPAWSIRLYYGTLHAKNPSKPEPLIQPLVLRKMAFSTTENAFLSGSPAQGFFNIGKA